MITFAVLQLKIESILSVKMQGEKAQKPIATSNDN